jgi:hypothetical protein
METIIGAVIALVGVALTQLVLARREGQRWKRETEQQSLSRIYDHRRGAYVDFMAEFDRLRLTIWNYHSGPDPGDMEVLFDTLYQRLTVVRIFGSDEAYNTATNAMRELIKWTYEGCKDDEALVKAFDDYVELVRKDLGVSEPAAARELVRAGQ